MQLFTPVPCNAGIKKSSASHFCLVRIRIHSFCQPILVFLRWLTNQSCPGQCYTNGPIASTVQMTDCPLPVFRWRYTPSLFAALPLVPVRFLHINVSLLFYPVAEFIRTLPRNLWFVQCSSLGPPVKF